MATKLYLMLPRKLAGLALRQCIDLGYHRSSKRLRSTANPLRLELQKRAFWCAYTMESQAAVMLGRPQGIPYQEVDAEVSIHCFPRGKTTKIRLLQLHLTKMYKVSNGYR